MKKKTLEDFIAEANLVHNFIYDYSKSVYLGALQKIEIICSIHGSFWQLANAHLQGQGCRLCRNEFYSQLFTSSLDLFLEKAIVIHGYKYDYCKVNYIRNDIKIIIICPEHGEFLQTPNRHLLGTGCELCGFMKISEGNKFTTEEFITECKLIHKDYYNYSEILYLGAHEKIEIVCPKHGSFWQRAASHLNGHGCPVCHPLSSGKEKEWLDSLNLPNNDIYRQVKIKIFDSYIIADGYNPSTNTIYEFYGDFWHGNPAIFKKDDLNPVNKISYGKLYSDTIEKEMLIKKQGFNLFTIWESEWNERIKNINVSTT